jgi:hypothetical protein
LLKAIHCPRSLQCAEAGSAGKIVLDFYRTFLQVLV